MDPRRVFPLYQRHVQTKILKLVGFMDKHVGVTGGFSARKLGTLECLQENLTNQLSRMEKDWDEVKCNFHWSQTGMEVVFNDTEKVVDDSRALVNEVLVKTEKFRTTVTAQTTCYARIHPTLCPQQKLSFALTLEESRAKI